MTNLLQREAFRRRAESYLMAWDPDIHQFYKADGIFLREACSLVAERRRARRLGLPLPQPVHRPSDPWPVCSMARSASVDWREWTDAIQDADQAQADRAAGRASWVAFKRILDEDSDRPMTDAERQSLPLSVRLPRLAAWKEWADGLRSSAERNVWTDDSGSEMSVPFTRYFLTDDGKPLNVFQDKPQPLPYLIR